MDLYEQQQLKVSAEGLPEGWGQEPGRRSSQQDILADENFIYIYVSMNMTFQVYCRKHLFLSVLIFFF